MNSSGQFIVPSGVLGGGLLKVDDYAEFLAREYLARYVSAGGAAVKVAVVGDSQAADRLESALAAATAEHSSLWVRMCADSPRVHVVDVIFFAVSRAVEWQGLAAAPVRAAYEQAASPVPAGAPLVVAEVARRHDVDARELYRSVRRLLERSLLDDPMVTAEMGRAMLRLAQAQLGAGDVNTAEHEAVLGWLRGELRSIAALRSALIYTRIGRHNARAMLLSTAALLLAAGPSRPGLRRHSPQLAVARRPPGV